MHDVLRVASGEEPIEHRLKPRQPVRVLVVQGRHERLAELPLEVIHERPGRAVVAEDLAVAALVAPPCERVLGAAVRDARDRRAEVAEEALDVALGTDLALRDFRPREARLAHRVVGEALVDPAELARRRVVLEQVLVLVRERRLHPVRERRTRAARLGGTRHLVVGRIRAAAMDPVERVDGHRVAVVVIRDGRREVAHDVAEAVRVVRVDVVLVADVHDERDDLVAVAAVVERQLAVRAVAVRRDAEQRRLRRVHPTVESRDQALNLVVRDREVGGVCVAAVTRRERAVVLHPDLDVLPDAAKRRVREERSARIEIDCDERPHRAERRRLRLRGRGGRRLRAERDARVDELLLPGLRRLELDVGRHGLDAVAPVRVPVAVPSGAGRGRGHREREQHHEHGKAAAPGEASQVSSLVVDPAHEPG